MNYDNYWKFISKCLCVCFLSEPKNKGNHAFFNLQRARKHIVTAKKKKKKKKTSFPYEAEVVIAEVIINMLFWSCDIF